MKNQPKRFEYGVGGLAVLVISIALAAIVYGMNLYPLDIYNIPAWILGPLGVYTVVYSLIGGSEATYFVVWGAIMVGVAIVSAFYKTVQPILVVGILVIVLAVIGLVAYMKGRK